MKRVASAYLPLPTGSYLQLRPRDLGKVLHLGQAQPCTTQSERGLGAPSLSVYRNFIGLVQNPVDSTPHAGRTWNASRAACDVLRASGLW